MKKQTAVEWLIEQVNHKGVVYNNYHMITDIPKEIIEQAKAMEKEQMYDAIRYTIEEQYWRRTWANCEATLPVAEEYYFLTFEDK